MRGTITWLLGALLVVGFASGKKEAVAPSSIYEFEMKDIDGKKVSLQKYQGKVAMIVNVASRCGFTPQYEGLEKLYEKYRDKGFVILGFPANNFLNQEPGNNKQIKKFCHLKYGVKFPMFSKISVRGKDKAPLYRFLTSQETNPNFGGEITWNFNKFLLDREGNIAARFDSSVKPESQEIVQALVRLLEAKETKEEDM